MLYLILLIFFLIQFLAVLGALSFVILLARPEVLLLGDSLQEGLLPKIAIIPCPARPRERLTQGH